MAAVKHRCLSVPHKALAGRKYLQSTTLAAIHMVNRGQAYIPYGQPWTHGMLGRLDTCTRVVFKPDGQPRCIEHGA